MNDIMKMNNIVNDEAGERPGKTGTRAGVGGHEAVDAKDMPLAVGCLMDDVAEIKGKLDFLLQNLGMGAAGIKPVTIKEAAAFLSVSENVVRRMVREMSIPYYRRGGKTYFFEKELLEWVRESRVAAIDERLNNFNFRRIRR